MLISCEKCTTTYVLDERLIPPGGAPVQCTKCNHVFIALSTHAAAPPLPKTLVPGTAPPEEPAPQPDPRGTQIFGRTAPATGPSSSPSSAKELEQLLDTLRAQDGLDENLPPEPKAKQAKTQLFAVSELNRPAQPAPPAEAGEGRRAKTQLFALSEVQAAANPKATQMFGVASAAVTGPTQPRGPAEAPVHPRATQIFGATGLDTSAPATLQDVPAVRAPDARATMIFGGAPTASNAPHPRETFAERKQQRSSQLAPTLIETSGRLPGALAPVSLPEGDLPQMNWGGDRPGTSVDEGSELDLRRQMQRRNRLAMGAVLAVLLIIAVGVGIKVLSGRRPSVPPEAIAEREAAMALLRRDDSEAQAEAVAKLSTLSKAFPFYVDAVAGRVLALSLQLDDARIAVRRFQSQSDELNRKIARLKEAKSPGNWLNQVNALIDDLAAVKAKSDPLIDEAARLDGVVNEALQRLRAHPEGLAPEEEQVVVRAQAIYFGVKGSDQAIALSERYKRLRQGADDGWSAVAFAEYALNARVAPETLRQAREQLEEVIAKDKTFLRPYVLAARLAQAEKNDEAASNLLGAVMLLNRRHEVAAQLHAWVTASQKAAAATR
ncbi:MAG: zinc-ribbon domain-containing protein [Myxococcota bacterium]